MKRCYSCFHEYDDIYSVCPYCAQLYSDKPIEPIHLTPGTIVANRYIIGFSVGSGGFGIVYKAWDTKLETVVAIKEFFVSRLSTRAEGLKNLIVNKKSQTEFEYRKERFLAEARNMAKFGSHRSIPNVFEFFEENNTAYIVMELLNGVALNQYLNQTDKLDVDFAIMIANEIGHALKSLHENKIIHRDVAPDNIYICTGKEIRLKLMDLGAAKLEDNTDDIIDIILKPGYSPPEQYDNTKNIGPWTDIYALGATLYMMLTGIKPDESTNRKIKDELVPVSDLNPLVSENLNNTIMKALAIETHMRFKTIDEFLKALNGEKKIIPLKKEKKRRRNRRIISIIAAALVIVVSTTFVLKNYNNKKIEAGYLNDANISIWFPVSDDLNKKSNIDIISKKFQKTYNNLNTTIDIEIVPIEKDEYEDKLLEALETGEMPNLFESAGLSDEFLKKTIKLDDIVSSEQFLKCSILNKNYDTYCEKHNKMPMSANVPVVMIVTKGPKSLEYNDEFFSSFDDFNYDGTIAVDSTVSNQILKKNFEDVNFEVVDIYTKDELVNYPVVLTTTESISRINKIYANKYQYKFVFPDTDVLYCEFISEWSINNSSDKDENAAAEMFLKRMLNEDFQTNLCGDSVPVCDSVIGETKYLKPIKEIYHSFVF